MTSSSGSLYIELTGLVLVGVDTFRTREGFVLFIL